MQTTNKHKPQLIVFQNLFYDNIIKYSFQILQIDYDYKVVEDKQQFQCLNDQHKQPFFLPCLKIADQCICGSETIMLWIAQQHAYSHFFGGIEQMELNNILDDYIISKTDFHSILQIFEQLLQSKKYLTGNQLGFVDIYFYCLVKSQHHNLHVYPKIQNLVQTIAQNKTIQTYEQSDRYKQYNFDTEKCFKMIYRL